MPDGEFVVDDSYLVPRVDQIIGESGDTSVVGYPPNGVVIVGCVSVGVGPVIGDDGGDGSIETGGVAG